jgi:hypothetical protein
VTTPLLGSDVGQRLVEHPLVTEWVIHRGLPLAVFPVVQRIDQVAPRASAASTTALASATLSIT